MAKIEMIRRNRVFSVDARLAPLLEAHGGYQRRDMQAQPAAAPIAASAPAAATAAAAPATVTASEPTATDLAKQQMRADGGIATRKVAKNRNGAAAPKTSPAKDEI
ncbi:hypothetical protein [Stenotrophomonas sp. SMYL20]|uniref:hypothetical protein n=1 Tax=Stenotrophomonas sp. SMYL20 TaxID=3076043 RepID=UPI002E797E7B|nr:hypothetical protein [Stenotrophomonas sp. SMYL20]